MMQREFNGSQGQIVPVLLSMKHRIAQVPEKNKDGLPINLVTDFKTALLSTIENRFKNCFLFEESNKELLLAAISTPRFKGSFIEKDDDLIFTKNLLIAECKKMRVNIPDIAQERNCNVTQDEFLVSVSRDVRRNSLEAETDSEVARFLCDVRTDDSILNEFPNIKAVFSKYNTTICSSAPIERVFSQSLMIFAPRRNRLSAVHFEQTLHLKHNRIILKKIMTC